MKFVMVAPGLFNAKCISPALRVGSKKQLLSELTTLTAKCPALVKAGASARDLLSAVMERERLGTTGIGSGVAIPHARVPGLESMTAAFARLETPIEYESVDDRPVDLVVMLLAPENAGAEHLRALARVSRLLRREEMRNRLRAAPDAEGIFALLMEDEKRTAA